MAKSREKDMLKHSSKFLIIATSIVLCNRATGQITDSIKETKLPSIMIKAFEQNRKLQDIPAAISYIGKGTLTEYSPTSIVSAMNTVPGVRMEAACRRTAAHGFIAPG